MEWDLDATYPPARTEGAELDGDRDRDEPKVHPDRQVSTQE